MSLALLGGLYVAQQITLLPFNNPTALFRADSTEMIVGRASVIDGDTIEIHGTRIRLNGIDAPESRQRCEKQGRQYRCGQHAAEALSNLAGERTVSCEKLDTDRYGRAVARCTVNGSDIGREMVRQGWAIAYRQYSSDYIPDEAFAEGQKAGIWAGRFENPADFRRR